MQYEEIIIARKTLHKFFKFRRKLGTNSAKLTMFKTKTNTRGPSMSFCLHLIQIFFSKAYITQILSDMKRLLLQEKHCTSFSNLDESWEQLCKVIHVQNKNKHKRPIRSCHFIRILSSFFFKSLHYPNFIRYGEIIIARKTLHKFFKFR